MTIGVQNPTTASRGSSADRLPWRLTVALAVVALLVLLPGPVQAFKDSEHAELTRRAWTLYVQWLHDQGLQPVIDDIEPVIEGTVAEDALTISRARNWHFFNPDGRLVNNLLFNRSSGPRLAELVRELMTRYRSNDRQAVTGLLAGRILHHIQDMSIPAHAVPIYHGPGLLDSFELYAGAHLGSTVVSVQSDEITAALGSLPDKPANQLAHFLYAHTARRTLEALRQPIPLANQVTGLTWSDFWTPCDPENAATTCDPGLQGFGIYGALGNNYGAADPAGSSEVLFTPEAYSGFFSRQIHQVMVSTILWLYVYDRLLLGYHPSTWAKPFQVSGIPNLYQVSATLYRSAQPSPEGWPTSRPWASRRSSTCEPFTPSLAEPNTPASTTSSST